MRKIKVLVVEDSILFQRLLADNLNKDPMIEVIAVASNPYEARDEIIKEKPDVMTLDLEMPRMGGLEFLQKLMPQVPIPTVVISSLSDKVFDAIQAGAVDFVAKPSGKSRVQVESFICNELATKVKIASTVKVDGLKKPKMEYHRVGLLKNRNADKVIAIGASTGGTEAIFDVISKFEADIPGVVVVQHMPPGFTNMYANRLNQQCKVVVKEAEDGDRVLPGQVLIAPGDKQMRLKKVAGHYEVSCQYGERVSGHCPSVDVLFSSVAEQAGKDAVGVILTGMGRDGAAGLLQMRQAGAKTIGQNQESCVVYGMPKEAFLNGAVVYQEHIDHIADRVYRILEDEI
ncbi:MAG: chemotaxis response regulator protein-glutamate methylesterase [Lachnospiraceae bacterium]|nr:chemotaxis response regulator protein-glutamate methylesterase [Lachnospiraceae bacterium]